MQQLKDILIQLVEMFQYINMEKMILREIL